MYHLELYKYIECRVEYREKEKKKNTGLNYAPEALQWMDELV